MRGEHVPAEILDFEIGAFGGALKKVGKGIVKGVSKVADVTIAKPTEMIGGAIGGKKGAALGKKIGNLAAKVTTGATLIGAAPAMPTLSTALIGTAVADKAGLLKKSKPKAAAAVKPKAAAKTPATIAGAASAAAKALKPAASGSCSANGDAAKVGALLVAKLSGPLGEANKRLKLAEIQRTATSEHNRLMQDSEFRKKVLAGITNLALNGNAACERTVRVLIGR